MFRFTFGALFMFLSFIALMDANQYSRIKGIEQRPFVYEHQFIGRRLPGFNSKLPTTGIWIEVPFEETGKWGEDGILVYTLFEGSAILKDQEPFWGKTRLVLEAWRPDPITAGAFQHSTKTIQDELTCYSIGKVELLPNGFKIYPSRQAMGVYGRTVFALGLAIIGAIFWAFLFLEYLDKSRKSTIKKNNAI